MTVEQIETIMARQAELIAALDARDASAITHATEALAAAVALAKNAPPSPPEPKLRETINEALQQANGAAIRTNYLLHWTRQNIGRISELRGVPSGYRAISY
jgi:hypothetical protein